MTPITKHPEYAAAAKEIEGLAAALGKVQGRIAEIESLLRAPVVEDRDSSHVAAALRFAETGQVEGPGNNPSALSEEHLILRQQAEALTKALTARQQARDQLAGELSAAVCRDLEAEHRKLAGRALEALKALDALSQEEVEMIRAVEHAGYRVNFREYVRWPYLGTLSMGSSEAAIWSRVRELQNYVL